MKLMETGIDTEEFQRLQTLTELMYTAKNIVLQHQ